jgi:hypothetical protein
MWEGNWSTWSIVGRRHNSKGAVFQIILRRILRVAITQHLRVASRWIKGDVETVALLLLAEPEVKSMCRGRRRSSGWLTYCAHVTM